MLEWSQCDTGGPGHRMCHCGPGLCDQSYISYIHTRQSMALFRTSSNIHRFMRFYFPCPLKYSPTLGWDDDLLWIEGRRYRNRTDMLIIFCTCLWSLFILLHPTLSAPEHVIKYLQTWHYVGYFGGKSAIIAPSWFYLSRLELDRREGGGYLGCDCGQVCM